MAIDNTQRHKPIFLLQKEEVRALHYGFRLEKHGVVKSWEVRKALPTRRGVKRLALEVEGHDLENGEFTGTTPEDEYSAGTVEICDRVIYEAEESLPDRIVFKLDGARLKGQYCLVRFKRARERNWLLFRL